MEIAKPETLGHVVEQTDASTDQNVVTQAERIITEAHERACSSIHAFDRLIGQLRQTIGGIDSVENVRVVQTPSVDSLPFAIGEHANHGIVLKSRCAVELGGTLEGSCALTLSTSDVKLVHDGCVTIVGPDIPELTQDCVHPFAQVILVAGAGLTGEDHQGIEDCQDAKDWIDGYLVRGGAGELWTRISQDLFARGLSFAQLGSALGALIKERQPKASRVEIVFITSSKADVEQLCALRNTWKDASHSLRHDTWMGKGLDIDCPSGGHCGSCGDKEICDQVRKIQRMRRLVSERTDGKDGANA